MNLDFDDDNGCLGGLLRLFLLGWLFDWLQDNIGFGQGGCGGCGCGVILLIVFVVIACSIIFNTNWFQFGF